MNLQKKIFIIEDNNFFALLLKKQIENSFPEENFQISVFESGEDCEGMIYVKPDLAIVDYHLDNSKYKAMSGLELIDIIRKRSPETDYIIITSDEETELFLRSKERNIYDYLIKNDNVLYNLTLSISKWLKYNNKN